MIRFIQLTLLSFTFLYSTLCSGIQTDTVKLHIQVFNKGICIPMLKSTYYSTSRFQNSKSVFQAGSYYSTIYAYINSTDTTDLHPLPNHKLQSSSLQLNPKKDYELVLLRYRGFDKSNPDSMLIKIKNLSSDAQVIIPFKKGKFELHKMNFFKKLNTNTLLNFQKIEHKAFKLKLKLNKVTRFSNENVKANYFFVSKGFPLYYVQEFDSTNATNYVQGFLLILDTNQTKAFPNQSLSVWRDNRNTRYGYWEYYENGKRTKHELWASQLQEQFEWYPSGQLKVEMYIDQYGKGIQRKHFLEDGTIKEEAYTNPKTRKYTIKQYTYSQTGNLVMVTAFDSPNGVIKQGLQSRTLFYPSGQLKMEENFIGTYNIKYYNQDGTERNK